MSKGVPLIKTGISEDISFVPILTGYASSYGSYQHYYYGKSGLACTLPKMHETELQAYALRTGIKTKQLSAITPPLPGEFTKREGVRLKRSELLDLVDTWLEFSDEDIKFVIQGGNRYISHYLSGLGILYRDLKIMSVDKAPLYNQLISVLEPDEAEAIMSTDPATGIPITRRQALQRAADYTMTSPFASFTDDTKLHNELSEAIKQIDNNNSNSKFSIHTTSA